MPTFPLFFALRRDQASVHPPSGSQAGCLGHFAPYRQFCQRPTKPIFPPLCSQVPDCLSRLGGCVTLPTQLPPHQHGVLDWSRESIFQWRYPSRADFGFCPAHSEGAEHRVQQGELTVRSTPAYTHCLTSRCVGTSLQQIKGYNYNPREGAAAAVKNLAKKGDEAAAQCVACSAGLACCGSISARLRASQIHPAVPVMP